MRLNPKEIEDLVASLVGRDALGVLRLIKNKKNVSEFKVAEKMKQNINQIRNVLYRMNEYNLVGFTRKKDKKKGWYIYYWTFDEKEANKLYVFLKSKKLEELRNLLVERKHQEIFFVCKTDFLKFKLEDALDLDFRCPECGKVLKEETVVIDLDKIRKEISQIEADISSREAPKPSRRPEKPKSKKSKKPLKKSKKSR